MSKLIALLAAFIAFPALGQTVIYSSSIMGPVNPATAPPPDIAGDGAVGSSTQYARADHTHKSSVQAARITVAGGAGQVTWTFPTAYSVGKVPVCTAMVISTSAATQPLIVTQAGEATNTSVSFKVFTAQTQTVSILGTLVNLFTTAANSVAINAICRLPST